MAWVFLSLLNISFYLEWPFHSSSTHWKIQSLSLLSRPRGKAITSKRIFFTQSKWSLNFHLYFCLIDFYFNYLLLLLSRFSRVRLCDPTDGSPPGSSVPGILQAKVLEWVAISFSKKQHFSPEWTLMNCSYTFSEKKLSHKCISLL